MYKPRLFIVFVLLIAALAVWLRWWPDGSMVPGRTYLRNDEIHYLDLARRFLTGQFGVLYFINPTLYVYVLAACTALAGLVRTALGLETSLGVFLTREIMTGYAILWTGRMISILASSLSTILIYRVARRLFSPGAGVLAALAYALDGLAQSRALLCGTESLMVLIELLAVDRLLAVQPRDSSRLGRGFAGCLLGLAVATKYSSGILFVVFIVVLRFRVFPALLGMVIGFILGCPMSVLRLDAFLKEFLRQTNYLHEGFREDDILQAELGFVFYVRTFAEAHHGVCFAVVCLMGILASLWAAIRWRNAAHRTLLVCTLPLYLFLGTGIFHHERFLLPMIPFALIHGACLLERLVAKALTALPLRDLAVLPLAAAILVGTSIPALTRHRDLFRRMYGAPDLHGELFVKLREHLARDAKILEFAVMPAERVLIEAEIWDRLGLRIPDAEVLAQAEHQIGDELHLLPGASPLKLLMLKAPDMQSLKDNIAETGADTLLLVSYVPLQGWLRRRLKGVDYRDEFLDWLYSLPRRALVTTSDASMVAAVLDLR